MGMIATSCVALRPLVNRVIRLESSAAGYGGYGAGVSGRVGAGAGVRSKSHRGFAEIELDESSRAHLPHSGKGGMNTTIETGTFYEQSDQNSSSEEAIIGLAKGNLSEKGHNGDGIRRTTQVEVKYMGK